MVKSQRNSFLRLNWRRRRTRFRAALRDTYLLIREFWGPLILFTLVIIGCGLLYYELAVRAGEPIKSQAEAVYLTLLMTFLQSASNFPQTWYLQLFYFGMPVVGLGILAQGLADFGVLLFNRRSRTKEWEMAVASTLTIPHFSSCHAPQRASTQPASPFVNQEQRSFSGLPPPSG